MYRAERIRFARRTLALIGIFMSPGSHALGVGELRLQSALNQTLKAEVPLVVSDEKLDDIKVMLAPPEVFAQAGIERQQFLSSLRFQPERRADGNCVIRISSREPVRDPFLSFLMEVNWPDGRVVKEFTVLVDPPAQVLPGLSPAGQAEPSSQYRRAPAPRSPYFADSPPSPDARRPKPAEDVSEYGPIRRRDTLSSIARAVNADGDLTPEQVKVGIYRANPDAFIGGNVNALRRGVTLNIPPRGVLAERQPAEAAREWRELRAAARRGSPEEAAGVASERPPAASAPVPLPEGGEAAARGSRLKLLAPGSKGQAGRTGGKEDLALEVAESLRQENEEIRVRLGALEQQLSTLQKLLELREQQIAAMQPVAPAAGTAAGVLPAAASPAASAMPSPEPSPVAETAAGAPVVTVAIQPPAEATAQPEEEPANGAWLWGVGFGAITLAAALAWWANRKRRLFTFGLGLPSSLDMLMAGKKEPAGGRTVPSAGVRSLESYRNAAKAVDSGEPVDPIAETDAFLANGKHAQAEQLMRAAVAAHPEREDFHLKLLEILYLGGKYQAFEELAEDVSGWRETRPELWGEVSRMSLKLRLKSPAQADAPDTLPEAASAAPPPLQQVVGEPAPELPLPPPSAEEALPDSREADSLGGTARPEMAEVAAEEVAPLEFELSGLDTAAPGGKAKDEPEVVHDAGNLIAYEPEPYAGTAVQSGESLESLLAELEGLGDSAGKPRVEERSGLVSESPITIEIEAVPAARHAGTAGEPGFGTPGLIREDTDPYADITDMDPLETKLDLSKAYVDMGDADSARELLEDILAAGSDRQKAEARVLMDRVTGTQDPAGTVS
ncbi:FimV/HubP family polar landmark protein [Methylococcus sp. ANG]|uniref:FimV/HubP family polar landmark protein n=1 Tax=Methylococcus sp. ANG TaxID=3231903 RepID=UPI00345A8F51